MTALAAELEALSQKEFRIGRALSKALGIYYRNGVSFSIVAMLAWLPAGAFSLYSLQFPPNERDYGLLSADLWEFLVEPAITAAILYAAFQDMRGRPVRIAESVKRGLRRFFPLLGASILVFAGMALGLVLLVIPSIILMIRWSLVGPVCVVEQMGPLRTLDRSAELTKGNRWKLFAIFLIMILVEITVDQLLMRGAAMVGPIAGIAVKGAWHSITGAFEGVAAVVFYHDLRVQKEGADIESIASVFD